MLIQSQHGLINIYKKNNHATKKKKRNMTHVIVREFTISMAAGFLLH